jgi:hypothetical protein
MLVHTARLLAISAACALVSSTIGSARDVLPWRPANIASSLFESHATFDPLTGDCYFVRSSREFRGWRILVAHPTPHGWSPAEPAPFAGDGVEADPFFADGGRTRYFISTRTTDSIKRADLDLWRVDRRPDGTWETPVRLPAPVNSPHTEWFPRPAADGWLYFGSDRPGGHGGNDIWRARRGAHGAWQVENLGPEINTADDEFEPLPSPDGNRLIIMTGDGLYESRRTAAGGWSPKVKLPPDVNVNGTEIGATFSPSGKSMLFSRDTRGPDSGEFFLLREGGNEDWPPDPAALARPGR